MKTFALAAGACLAVLIPLTLATTPQETPAKAEPSRLVVGTFDSRGIAIAYANSELFRDRLSGWRRQHEEAKQAGDEELALKLEAEAQAQQVKFHHQAFSTAPVGDILVHLEGRLPALAREAGVDLIVSRWDVAWRDPSARLVDVTGLLVNEFHPDERALKSIAKLAEVDPIPESELGDCLDD